MPFQKLARPHPVRPVTEWAFGALSNYASLTFATWQGFAHRQISHHVVGKEIVLHLTVDDVYLSIEFSAWGSGGSGGFAYGRSTPAPLTLLGGEVNGGQFTFSYATGAGLQYTIDSSSNLVDWSIVATNTGSGGMASFGAPVVTTGSDLLSRQPTDQSLTSHLISKISREPRNREH